MTVAIAVKVNDGIVLAADSASSLSLTNGGVVQIYNNANKVFNLKKGHPIAAATCGLGNIGSASMEMLCKDFRQSLDGLDYESIEEIAKNFSEFVFKERYLKEYKDDKESPYLAFWIAGYSKGSETPELWKIIAHKGKIDGPVIHISRDREGIEVFGQPELVFKLTFGIHPEIILRTLKSKSRISDESALRITKELMRRNMQTLVHSAMPIQDAIDLADFLVQTTIGYVRFIPGAPTVGGSVDIAAITKHEGFMWIRRKHFYDYALNPHDLHCPR